MSIMDLIAGHSLAALGKTALSSTQEEPDATVIAEFTTAISGYSEARSADWRKVRELATALAPVRPELRIFCYLALSSFCDEKERQTEGTPYLALAASLSSLADLVELGWARCLPRSPKARDNQLDWLSRELAWVVKDRPPALKDVDAFQLCLEVAQRVGDLHGQATGVQYPLFRDARTALGAHKPAADELLKAREAAQARAAKAAEPPAPKATAVESAPAVSSIPAVATSPLPPPVPPPAVSVPAPATDPAAERAEPAVRAAVPADMGQLDPEEAQDALATLVVRVASQQRAQSLTAPAPYWMLRALRWASHDFLRRERVRELAASGYRTPLPPPPGHAALLEDAPKWLAEGQYARVVETCEEMFEQSPLFLDLQRLIALGLEGLGATAARQAVGAQVALLLAYCPEVTRFRFGDFDATPMASAETQTWLEGESTRGVGAPSNGASPPAGTSAIDAPLPSGLAEGIGFLQQRSARAPHRQEQFEIELRMAELLLRHDRRDVALPLARSLIERAGAYRLAEWRPDLLTHALRIGYEAAQTDDSGSAESATFFAQLCQLSPQDAVELVSRREIT